MKKLFFSKTCLLIDAIIQKKENVSVSIGICHGHQPVIFTEALDNPISLEYMDSDYIGEGIFLKDVLINREFLIKLIKKERSNEKVLCQLLEYIKG